jgi:hypothetical protein
MVREPQVCGQFYPSNPRELERLISNFTPQVTTKVQAKGALLPHAGYIYSGRVAVTTVAKVSPKERVIILGPNHTGFGEEFSIYSRGKWRMPWGLVDIDEELASKILEKGSYIKEDTLAHRFEHSIEVELPILRHFFSSFKFVPIVCSTASLDMYRKVANQIYQGVKDTQEQVLIIASGDMTHYEPDHQARKKDRLAIESILHLDEEELLKRVKKENISMCGIATVSIMLSCAKLLGSKKAEVTLYQTSGDVTGDTSSVVGYLGVIVS